MTLSTTTVRASVIGSGSAGPFVFPMKVFAATDLLVQKTSATGVVTALAYPTDYTVSGVGNASGGTVTLTVALAVGETLSILRATPNTQPTSFRSLGTFFPASHEDEFDRVTMLVQQNTDAVQRSARLASSIDPTNMVMELTPSTGKVLGWASSTQLTNVSLDSSAVALPGQSRTVATLSAYLANNAVFNILDYGANGNGIFDNSTAVTNTLAAASAAGGGIVYVPAGTFIMTTSVALPSNVILMGTGPASILSFLGAAGDVITATSKTNITLQSLQIVAVNRRVLFTTCTKIRVFDCLFTGTFSNGTQQISGQGIWTMGCTGLVVSRTRFVDYRDNIYLDADGSSTVTDNVIVDACVFERTTNGNLNQFTTGVYCFQVGYVAVSNSTFTNLYPGLLTGSPMGYGVYEGDGTATDIRVVNNTFIANGVNAVYFTAMYTSRSTNGLIAGNTVKSDTGTTGYGGASQYTTVIGNAFDNAIVSTQMVSGGPATYRVQIFEGNSFRNMTGTTGVPLTVMIVGSPNLDQAIIQGNHFYNATKGAIWIASVTHATVLGNTIIDCNTSNNSNDQYRGGINFLGCTDGFVDGNTVMNVGSGSMQYGVVLAATTNSVNVTVANRFRSMTTGNVLRFITAPPPTGAWTQGTRLHNWGIAAAGVPGWICVTTGSPGTWKAEAAIAS